MGIASFVIGIIACSLSFVPIMNYFVVIPALVGRVLGIIEIINNKKQKQSAAMSYSATALNSVAVFMSIVWSVLIFLGISSIKDSIHGNIIKKYGKSFNEWPEELWGTPEQDQSQEFHFQWPPNDKTETQKESDPTKPLNQRRQKSYDEFRKNMRKQLEKNYGKNFKKFFDDSFEVFEKKSPGRIERSFKFKIKPKKLQPKKYEEKYEEII